jgi:hypothetical protein
LALESALGDLHRLKNAQAATVERDRRGRRLVEASVHSGEWPDRQAGLEESRVANRSALALAPLIEDAEIDVVSLREAYLASRVERRQAETLIQEAEAQEALEAERKSQHGLDDWFRNRMHREAAEEMRDRRASPRAGSVLPAKADPR